MVFLYREIGYTTIIIKGHVHIDIQTAKITSNLGLLTTCDNHARLCETSRGVIIWSEPLLAVSPWKIAHNQTECFQISNHLFCDKKVVPIVAYKDMFLKGKGYLGIGKYILRINKNETILKKHEIKHEFKLEKINKITKIKNSSSHQIATIYKKAIQTNFYENVIPSILSIMPAADQNFINIHSLIKSLSKLVCKNYKFSHRLLGILSLDNPRVVSALSQADGHRGSSAGDIMTVRKCDAVKYTVICDPKFLVKDDKCPKYLLVNPTSDTNENSSPF